MNMGGPGDHPLTDLLHWGKRPFPIDVEEMILRLRDVSPRHLDRVSFDEFSDWSRGLNLDAGRTHLRMLISEYEADLKALTK